MRITLLGAWGFILSLPAYKYDVGSDFRAHFDPTSGVLADTATNTSNVILWLIFSFAIFLLWKRRRDFPDMIMHEEVVFREGAENWSLMKRIRMAAYFGFAHLANWIYPISTCVMIAIVGFIVGEIYRKNVRVMNKERAIHDAAILHLTYDIIALGFFLVGYTLITVVTFF